MPIEHEHKYILRAGKDLFTELIDKVKASKIEFSVADFKQGYLYKGSRIRTIDWRYIGGYKEKKESAHDLAPEYIFTYKHKINGDVVEIETPISPNDFNRLWDETEYRLTKTRFSSDIPINQHNEHWEIDFFHDPSGKIYFAMAECEMHHGKEMPTEMPDFVYRNMLLERADNSEYSSKKLSEIRYAKEKMKILLGGSNNA